MGSVGLSETNDELIIRSALIFYGDAANTELALQCAKDVSDYWNEPSVQVLIKGRYYSVRFEITGEAIPELEPEKVWFNLDPAMNFFRVEEYVDGNISFVDGLPCNTGYFKLANLLQTGTTIAHEYGHTLGLAHPEYLDVRGETVPGIMYPRGTICDPALQYDPLVQAGEYGGVLDPAHRRVLPSDIAALRLHKLTFDSSGVAILGEFTSIYHEKHTEPTILG